MQNRYACDVGDFGKYGLLRKLCSPAADQFSEEQIPENNGNQADLKLGIVWYMTPDDAKGGDGRHTGYLKAGTRNRREFRNCDPALYDVMEELVTSERRNVKSLQEAGVLPQGTIFYDTPLSMAGVKGDKKGKEKGGTTLSALQKKRGMRREWLKEATSSVLDAQVVFLDPDNGLETQTVERHTIKGPKYAYYDDLRHYTERGQSVVIYHHLNRRIKARQQILQCETRIFKETGHRAFAMSYHRGSARAFMIIPNGNQHHVLLQRAREMLSTDWAKHFEIII